MIDGIPDEANPPLHSCSLARTCLNIMINPLKELTKTHTRTSTHKHTCAATSAPTRVETWKPQGWKYGHVKDHTDTVNQRYRTHSIIVSKHPHAHTRRSYPTTYVSVERVGRQPRPPILPASDTTGLPASDHLNPSRSSLPAGIPWLRSPGCDEFAEIT